MSALHAIMQASPELYARAVAADAVQAVVGALRVFPDNLDVLLCASQALSYLALQDDLHADVVAAGAPQLLVEALQAHGTRAVSAHSITPGDALPRLELPEPASQATTVAKLCCALRCCGSVAGMRTAPQLVALGAIEAVVAALRAFAADESVQYGGLRLLGLLACVGAEQALRAGALRVAEAALSPGARSSERVAMIAASIVDGLIRINDVRDAEAAAQLAAIMAARAARPRKRKGKKRAAAGAAAAGSDAVEEDAGAAADEAEEETPSAQAAEAPEAAPPQQVAPVLPAALDAAAAVDAAAASAGAAGAAGGTAQALPHEQPATAEEIAAIFPRMRVDDQPAAPAPEPVPALAPPPAAPPPPAMPPPAPPAAAAAAPGGDDAASQQPTCVICLDAQPCVVLLPCKHLPLCGSPACTAMLGAPPLCPVCRAPVADTLSIFPAWAV